MSNNPQRNNDSADDKIRDEFDAANLKLAQLLSADPDSPDAKAAGQKVQEMLTQHPEILKTGKPMTRNEG